MERPSVLYRGKRKVGGLEFNRSNVDSLLAKLGTALRMHAVLWYGSSISFTSVATTLVIYRTNERGGKGRKRIKIAFRGQAREERGKSKAN